jgi:hypothetical protein
MSSLRAELEAARAELVAANYDLRARSDLFESMKARLQGAEVELLLRVNEIPLSLPSLCPLSPTNFASDESSLSLSLSLSPPLLTAVLVIK